MYSHVALQFFLVILYVHGICLFTLVKSTYFHKLTMKMLKEREIILE